METVYESIKFNVAIRKVHGWVAEGEFLNDTAGAQKCYELLANHKCKEVALESTGSYWQGLYDYLTMKGLEVTVVNPSKARSNVQNKTDRLDARALAILHLLGQLKASYIPTHDIRRLRRMTRFRAKLMDFRTAIKNSTNSSVASYSSGITNVFDDMFCKSGRKLLDLLGKSEEEVIKELEQAAPKQRRVTEEQKAKIREAVSNAYTPSLDSWFINLSSGVLTQIESWVKILDDAIARSIESIPTIKEYVDRLLTIKGVGLETAQAVVSEIADISRFESSAAIVRYSGLNPRIEQSGKVTKYGKLEKAGPKWLRRALYMAATTMAIRGPENFKNHFHAVKSRYGNKAGHGVAIASTSRKLMRLMWSMLTNNQDYIECSKQLVEVKRRTLRKRSEKFESTPNEQKPSLINLMLNVDKLNPAVRQMLSEL